MNAPRKYKWYHKTIFWKATVDTFTGLSGLTAASLHSLHTNDPWIWAAGACGILGLIGQKWVIDHNNNGIIDFFE